MVKRYAGGIVAPVTAATEGSLRRRAYCEHAEMATLTGVRRLPLLLFYRQLLATQSGRRGRWEFRPPLWYAARFAE